MPAPQKPFVCVLFFLKMMLHFLENEAENRGEKLRFAQITPQCYQIWKHY